MLRLDLLQLVLNPRLNLLSLSFPAFLCRLQESDCVILLHIGDLLEKLLSLTTPRLLTVPLEEPIRREVHTSLFKASDDLVHFGDLFIELVLG